jgi:hypothetical protein
VLVTVEMYQQTTVRFSINSNSNQRVEIREVSVMREVPVDE